MALLDELFEGSFRGVRFLVKSATTVGGRKQVKHDYPNSDVQKIEDLGFQPRNFKLTAIITGDDYTARKNALLDALETAGNGTLSHPFFTNSVEVTARNYTLSEEFTQLEVATFELEFDYSNSKTDPQPAKTSLSQINQKVNETTALVESDIAASWNVSGVINYDSARALLTNFIDTNVSVTNTFSKVSDAANEYNALVSDFRDTVTEIIQVPTEVASSVIGLIQSSTELYDSIPASLQVFSRFFDYGDDFTEIEPTTVSRTQRNTNQALISDATQIAYLANAYQFACENEYTTVQDVEQIQELLETQYQKLRANDVPDEIIESLTELRILSNSFLEIERLNAAQVIETTTKLQPMSIIAFQYYGYDENFDALNSLLVDLNRPKSNNTSFIEGDIEIVTV